MQAVKSRSSLSIFAVIISCLTLVASARAQKPAPTKPAESADDVVRVNTSLVQTDVTVVDKRGRVIAGLTPDQFELRVDSKPQPVTFFEEIISGSPAEEKQLRAAREGKSLLATSGQPTRVATNQGQIIFFFVDDVHLAGESWSRARSLLFDFVNHKMKENDRVAIVSTSGQIGFLQQLTSNKAVLREAISRLNPKYNPETTASQVTISEVDANMVENHADRGLFIYLVLATMREYQMQNALSAVTMVKNRVRQINQQGKTAELATLYKLESLIRSTTPLAGRKVVFFVSDGFVADIKRSNGAEAMQRIGRQAANVGAVIYALDTRATFFGPGADVSRNDFPDSSGGTAWRSIAESKAPQEPLETLADETGGRSYLNANALDEGIAEALSENSAYYLLGWRPDDEQQQSGKSKIQVTVKGRPDLRVRSRRHFFEPKAESTSGAATVATAPEDDLKAALGSLYPRRDLPTFASGTFASTDKGAVLNVSMQIDGNTLTFDRADGKQFAVVDVLGVAIDDRGLCSTFRQKLEIPRESVTSSDRFVRWNQSLPLPPGLYQVRVAVRDRQSGRTGSAMLWIENPRTVIGPAGKK
ncbi:MAG: VWA domain-containing protein [Pyrinomonadaceae bacterium]